jgi:UDP-GlcNAc:undecaprenyl-phosphate/decaprenyl-phosphate GlcNAc-1-phosphate transferase
MPLPERHLLSFVASLILSTIACGLLLTVARSRRIESDSEQNRIGPGGVPLLGGIGLIFGAIGGLVVAIRFASHSLPVSIFPPELLAVGGIGLAYALLGLYDDVRGLSPLSRICAELLIATAGLYPLFAAISGPLAPVFAIAGAIVVAGGANFVNMSDNFDGLAALTVMISITAIARVHSLLTIGSEELSSLPLLLTPAIAGGIAGFLFWNRPAARLYLGDAGSLFLGVVVTLWLASLIPHLSDLSDRFALLAMAGYSVFDPVFVIVRRLSNKQPPWIGGTDHPSHDLRRLLGSDRLTLTVLVMIHLCAVATGAMVLLNRFPEPVLLLVPMLWIILLFAARRGAATVHRKVCADIDPQ